MKILLLFLSFFFMSQLQADEAAVADESALIVEQSEDLIPVGPCTQHNQLAFTHPLQYLDCKSHRMYPMAPAKDQIRIVIVPYSQDEPAQHLIAATYRVFQEQSFDKIIVLCSAQSIDFHGVALPCMINDSFLSQKISIDEDLIKKMSESRLFNYYQVPFYNNSDLHQQFVFLDFYVKNNVVLVPLMIGQISRSDAFEIAMTVANCCTDQTLIVVSADIAYHQNCVHDCPFDLSIMCKVYDQDSCKIQAIQSGSLEQQVAVFNDESVSSVFAVLFELLQLSQFKDVESDFVGYATSSCDITTNMEDIATYGAFIFQQSKSGHRNHIGFYEQFQLLQHARLSLQSLFEAPPCRLPCMISYEMSQPHGIFVSLYGMTDHGITLRGCMGKVQSKISLHDMMYQMTQQAACKDVRFYPIRQKELSTTIISLSVIIDFKKVDQCDEIQELDGVMLQYDDKEAVSLPSKITVPDWDYQQTLMHLSDQMGSYSFVWKKPRAKVFTFHSIVFQEE